MMTHSDHITLANCGYASARIGRNAVGCLTDNKQGVEDSQQSTTVDRESIGVSSAKKLDRLFRGSQHVDEVITVRLPNHS